MEVVVIGGTGAIGRCVMCALIESPAVKRITMLTRRQVVDLPSCPGALSKAQADGKVVQKVIDMEKMDEHKDDFGNPDTAIMALGSTRKDAGSAEMFRHIDYGYAMKFASICKEKSVKSYALVSAVNADAGSFFLYPKVKGEIENDTKNLGFPRLLIYQPGLLDRGDSARFVEKIGKALIGGIPVQTVGTAIVRDLVALDAEGFTGTKVYKDSDMRASAKAAAAPQP